MIVKVQNLEGGYNFYPDVVKVVTDLNVCFHNFGDYDFSEKESGLQIVQVFRDDDDKLCKNLRYVYAIDLTDLFVEFTKENLERYSSLEHIYGAKVIKVFQKNTSVMLGMDKQNKVYLLNDKGETVEKL